MTDQGTVYVSFGHLLEDDPNYGLPVRCYVCGQGHSASGMALIIASEELISKRALPVPLCDPCRDAEDPDNVIVRKYLQDPDAIVREVRMQ